MRWEDFRASDYVDDRRGDGGGGGGFGIPMGRAGGLGIGATIVLGLIGWALGIDPRILIAGADMATRGGGSAYERPVDPRQGPSRAPTRQGAPPDDQIGRFAAAVLGNTEDVWKELFAQQANRQYTPTPLVLYTRGTRSGCGSAQSAMGPFYCPLDRKVYLDTSFFQEMRRKFGTGGDFAYAYVIAHEVGHHIQNLLGILPRVQQRQQQVDEVTANNLSVRVELMADCLAGVWAKHSNERYSSLEPGDIEEAVRAAEAIGDDRLQGGGPYVQPDSFTHGSSAQRVRWFKTGYASGQMQSCDTFKAARL